MALIAETQRLIVRSWDLNDVPTLCDLTRLDGISEFSLSGYSNYSQEQSINWIQKEILRFEKFGLGKFAIVLKESAKLIGISGLFQQPGSDGSEIELNYRYPYIYRGYGYATEAAHAILVYGFKVLKLKQINANVDIRNTPSLHVLERLGMKRVGEVIYEGVFGERWTLSNPY